MPGPGVWVIIIVSCFRNLYIISLVNRKRCACISIQSIDFNDFFSFCNVESADYKT